MTTADLPTAERRLTRARDGRVVAGVCQGAARYFDIDPVIFRIVLAVLTVFGGAGVVIYVLGWVLIPEEGTPETRLERWLHGGRVDVRRIFMLAVMAVAVVVFLANTHVFAHRAGAAAVAVVAALLITDVVGRRRGHGLFTSRRTASPVYYGPAGPAAAAVPAPPVPAVVVPRERAWLGWLTLGAVLVTAGVMSLVASSGAAHPQPADVVAACVAIAGLGLVVGGFLGRARAMIPLGLLLVLGLGVTNALPRNLTWSAGTRDWVPTASTVAPAYVLGAGKADLDLSQLPLTTTTSVNVRIGVGRLHVFVPPGIGVVVDARLSAGRLHIFGRDQDGTGVSIHDVVPATSPHAGTLTLHLQGGFGDLEVLDAPA